MERVWVVVVHGRVHLQEEIQGFARVEALELERGGHVDRVEPRGTAAHLGREELPLEFIRGRLDAKTEAPLLALAVGFVVVLRGVRDVLVAAPRVFVRVGDDLVFLRVPHVGGVLRQTHHSCVVLHVLIRGHRRPLRLLGEVRVSGARGASRAPRGRGRAPLTCAAPRRHAPVKFHRADSSSFPRD